MKPIIPTVSEYLHLPYTKEMCQSCMFTLYLYFAKVFRHGDRSPVGTFPNDKYNESDWPQGYGQLSVVSVLQNQAPPPCFGSPPSKNLCMKP